MVSGGLRWVQLCLPVDETKRRASKRPFHSMTGNNALSNTVSSVFWHICIVRRDLGGVSFGACGSVLPRFMYCRRCFVGVHALVSEHRPLACFIETEGDDTKSYSQEKQFAM